MKIVFADAFYWIALINPGDDWHLAVRQISLTLYPATLITTEEVLTETLNFYASNFADHLKSEQSANLIHKCTC